MVTRAVRSSLRALKDAADVIMQSPVALQLRYLQTLTTIASEKNSTIVFPIPVGEERRSMSDVNLLCVTRLNSCKRRLERFNRRIEQFLMRFDSDIVRCFGSLARWDNQEKERLV